MPTYNINGCLKEMTELEHDAYQWSVSKFNPSNYQKTTDIASLLQEWLDINVRPARDRLLEEADSVGLRLDYLGKTQAEFDAYLTALRDFPETITEIPADGITPPLPTL